MGQYLSLRALGSEVRVDANSLTEFEFAHLVRLWELCINDVSRDSATEALADIVLVKDEPRQLGEMQPGPRLLDASRWTSTPYRLSKAVTLAALTRRANHDLLFHAAGLSTPEGKVLVLVGPSGAGKSTATRVLGQRYGYVSDEAVAIANDGAVHPYPKPISLGVVDKHEVSPLDLGLVTPPPGLHLGRLLMLARDASHTGAPHVEEVDILEAMVRAAAQTSGLTRLPNPLKRLATAIVTGGPPLLLRYRDIDDCVDLVDAVLAARSSTGVSWSLHPPPQRDRQVPHDGPAETPAAGWVRAPYVDALQIDSRVLVLRASVTTILEGIAALAWLTASSVTSAADITAAARRAYGPHDDADELVERTLHDLQTRRLLRLRVPAASDI